ncbi:tyrosine-type recombinase/integrase [Herpetosiphon llansteffanensis]|uniref:tyrosine-type recombinase/integrase n=1 Tax=Herpetosiphon llansteffanensis TaxID=2094568 RepID=UPI001F0BC98A|nr:tyrosine-type recombinase/integrase [Herpetosiphon llansteffanensis]
MSDSVPVAMLIDAWFRHAEIDMTHATCKRYRGVLHRLCAWFASTEQRSITLADLHPINLVGYREMLRQTTAVSTVNIHVSALRIWCTWLVDQGYLDTNPAHRLKLVKRPSPLKPKALSPVQVNALLRQAQTTRNPVRNTAILQMLVQTGMRIGECAALCWHDIQYGERSGQVVIRSSKGHTTRTVPLNESVRVALALYIGPKLGVEATIRAVAKMWPLHCKREQPRPLWMSERQTPLSLREMSAMIHHIVRDAAIRDLVPASTTPHSLRHTFATRYLVRHPHDSVGLARLLGHSSITTTQIYVQPTEADIANRVEQIDLNAYG